MSLMDHVKRIRELRVYVPDFQDVSGMLHKLDSHGAPRLQVLAISVRAIWLSVPFKFGGDTPALRTFKLSYCPVPWCLFKLSCFDNSESGNSYSGSAKHRGVPSACKASHGPVRWYPFNGDTASLRALQLLGSALPWYSFKSVSSLTRRTFWGKILDFCRQSEPLRYLSLLPIRNPYATLYLPAGSANFPSHG
ncbi:hypothetical protein L210DRAFT_601078 [Boletus edulis BED1]|uniref:Uncharacterized protein n=1 Tax=Boletus edulis BED1 TaxID=1328754 RepID=A0AAD4BQY0_BOLED|nr:hypothetical protein L210DRAFT_601078 [Boletus edulis BED1]